MLKNIKQTNNQRVKKKQTTVKIRKIDFINRDVCVCVLAEGYWHKSVNICTVAYLFCYSRHVPIFLKKINQLMNGLNFSKLINMYLIDEHIFFES